MPRGHGGLRSPAGGRPLGSKDRVPRAGTRKEGIEKLRQMVINAESGEYLWRDKIEPFEGNAFDLLRAIYQCNQIDIKSRMYAASKMIEHEPQAREAALQLLSNPSAQSDEDLDWIISQLDRLESAREFEAARRSAPMAELPPPAQPQVSDAEALPLPTDGSKYGYNAAEPAEASVSADERRIDCPPAGTQSWEERKESKKSKGNGIDPSPVSAPSQQETAIPQVESGGKIVVFCDPHRNFWVGGIGMISADEHGEIRVDDKSVAETLLAAGCSRTRGGI